MSFIAHPSALRPPRLVVFGEAGAPPLVKGRIIPSLPTGRQALQACPPLEERGG